MGEVVMSHELRKKIDWKCLVPKKALPPKRLNQSNEIKSYLQELAGHDLFISIVCNGMKNSLCDDLMTYLMSGNLYWYKYLKQASHLNLSIQHENVRLLIKTNSAWREFIIDLPKELRLTHQENVQ